MPAKKESSQPAARTTVRLPDEIHRRAKLAAAWSGMKIQDLVAAALEEYLTALEEEMHGKDAGAGRKSLTKPK
jgi:predicted HicB family RNase H-like nuclease